MFSRRSIPAAVAVLAGAAMAVPVAAQAPRGQSDFLFQRPALTLSVSGGWVVPGEGSAKESDVFQHTRLNLTVDGGAFASPVTMAEVAFRVSERLDLALGLEHASSTVHSEDREFFFQDHRPIEQSTRFARTGAQGSVKGYLFPRGRALSRFAWVPSRWSPYVGAGAGITGWKFVQTGDFVDYQTLDIFADEIDAAGTATTAHALAGIQLSLTPRFILKGEYRYLWGRGGVEGTDFSGFEAIDLSGSRATIGVAVRL